MNLDVKIVCKDKKYMPSYANSTDACLDLKARLDYPHDIINPSETIVYGTGVKMSIPEGYVMLVYPRSSTSIKMHCMLSNTTGVIDSGYRDEIKLAITNFGNMAVEIVDGQRLAQFMIIPRPKVNLIQVEDNDDFRNGDRGGGIGSTGV